MSRPCRACNHLALSAQVRLPRHKPERVSAAVAVSAPGRTRSVGSKNIPRIQLRDDVFQEWVAPVGHDHVTLVLELFEISYHPGVVELVGIQLRLVDQDLD